MTAHQAHDAFVATLELIAPVIDRQDLTPTTDPAPRYFVLEPVSPMAAGYRLDGRAAGQWFERVFLCVARTTTGARYLAQDAWGALDGLILAPGMGALTQIDAGPILPDGPTFDPRYSLTLAYRARIERKPTP